MISRKLHVVHDIPSSTLTVYMCSLDDIQRPSKLMSSTDGVVAMEVRTQALPTIRGWRMDAKRVITNYPSPGLLDYEVGVAQLARRAALAVFNNDVPLVILEVADAAMCRRPNAASRRRGRRSAQSGWLFPFVRPEPCTADTPWTLDRSLVGLPCDRPVSCISL